MTITTTTAHTQCEACEALATHSAILMEQSGAFEWTSTEGDHTATATQPDETDICPDCKWDSHLLPESGLCADCDFAAEQFRIMQASCSGYQPIY